MRMGRQAISFTLAGALALGVALGCGDSSGPGVPASVTGIAGDSQVGAVGMQLPIPLSFTVLDASGQPMQGVSVSWSATPSTGATMTPASGPTNASGIASTTVRLGTFVGEVVISGAVQGLQNPVTFHVVVLDPCANIVQYTLGDTVSGALATTDCLIGRWYNDLYALALPAEQQSIRVNMTSDVVDTYLELYRATGDFLGFHDDIDPGIIRNSQLDLIAAPAGNFVIIASSFDTLETGPYTMTATQRTAAFEQCGLTWVTRGVSVTDAVRTTDCRDTTGGTTRYFDFAAIWLNGGATITLTQRSTEMNPRIELRAGNGTLLAENDDSVAGTTTTAYLSYTVATTGPYIILPGTSVAGDTGAYTLEVGPPVTSSGAARVDAWGVPALGEVLRFGPVRLPKGVGPLPGGRRSH